MEWTGRTPELIFKELRGEISVEEAVELQIWVSRSEEHRAFYERFTSKEGLYAEILEFYEFRENVMEKIGREIPVMRPKVKALFSKRTWAYAAAVIGLLLVVGGGTMLMDHSPKRGTAVVKKAAAGSGKEVLPGRNRAVLTLGDGSMVDLDSLGKGAMARDGNAEIIKKDSGQLVYSSLHNAAGAVAYNILTTPRGGQYRVVLPDGSRVWLNAASSLRYPTSFAGNGRVVELKGEAYFEIAKDRNRPFQLRVNDLTVDVLGTSFNVMAYSDEPSVRTSLIEGAVRVRSGDTAVTLRSGQEADAKQEGLRLVAKADTSAVLAWKNGVFQFDGADIASVMRQVSRWYDVKVVYEGTRPVNSFSGVIRRSTNLSNLLKILELSGVHSRTEGNTVTIF
ncbi:MAG TPA: FecR domain-containing protein [Puia sp.]